MDTILKDSRTLILDDKVPDTFGYISVGQFDENMQQLGDATNKLKGPADAG